MPTKDVATCRHCKTNPVADGVYIAHACRTCSKALTRVVMCLHGRDPDTGRPLKNPDPLAWLNPPKEVIAA